MKFPVQLVLVIGMEGSSNYISRRILDKLIANCRASTVHGVPLIAAPKINPMERLFWFLIVALAASAAITLASQNVRRFYANPTVVSLQKDFRNWYNTFPSASICFMNKVDEELLDAYIEEKWGLNDTDSKYEYYKDFITVIASASYSTLQDLEVYKNDEDLNKLNFLEIAAKVHPELTGTLVTFDTTRKVDWELVMTEMGICFSMNTKFAKLFKYRTSEENVTDYSNEEAILKCHYLNGLCYARYDSDPQAPLNIYIHSHLDIVHATSEPPLIVKESEELEINYRMQETKSATRLKDLRPSQRRCRFDNEPIDSEMPAYSTSICYISCRYRLVMKLCNCRPFFYNNFPGKICGINGMLCVARHAEFLTQAPAKLGCHCPQPCDLITYLAEVPKITVWEYGYFDQRTTFRWGLLPPTTKYHRDVLFGFEDLVVSIGGIVALFLGVSFITGVEVVFAIIDILQLLVLPPKAKISDVKFVGKWKTDTKNNQTVRFQAPTRNTIRYNKNDANMLRRNRKERNQEIIKRPVIFHVTPYYN